MKMKMKKKVDETSYLWALSLFCLFFYEKRDEINRKVKMYDLMNLHLTGGRTSVLHCAGLKPRLHSLQLIMNMLVDEDLDVRMEG